MTFKKLFKLKFLHFCCNWKQVPMSTVQRPFVLSSVKSVTDHHNLDSSLANEITNAIIKIYPFYSLISNNPCNRGELVTRKLRQKYVRENLYVQPQEIQLGYRDGKLRTYTYIPILSVLRNLILKIDVLQTVVSGGYDLGKQSTKISTFFDGICFKQNNFCQQNGSVVDRALSRCS